MPCPCRAATATTAPPRRTARLSHVPLRSLPPGLQRAHRHTRQPVLAVYSIRSDSLAIQIRECQDLGADGLNGQHNGDKPQLIEIGDPLAGHAIGRLCWPLTLSGTSSWQSWRRVLGAVGGWSKRPAHEEGGTGEGEG